MHFFGQLPANAFGGRNLFNACFPEAIHRAEPAQQQILPVLANSGAIIEDAFLDSFFHEQLMIRVGKPMCFIADALKQTQGGGIHWKSQRQPVARAINLLPLLRQADDREIMQT